MPHPQLSALAACSAAPLPPLYLATTAGCVICVAVAMGLSIRYGALLDSILVHRNYWSTRSRNVTGDAPKTTPPQRTRKQTPPSSHRLLHPRPPPLQPPRVLQADRTTLAFIHCMWFGVFSFNLLLALPLFGGVAMGPHCHCVRDAYVRRDWLPTALGGGRTLTCVKPMTVIYWFFLASLGGL